MTVSIVDADSHVLEPADVWTSRIATRFGDQIPHVEREPESGASYWRVGKRWIWPAGHWAPAGQNYYPPLNPTEYDEVDLAAYDAQARLKKMDELGLEVQVLFPNIVGFHAQVLLEELGSELALMCVQAYNDFVLEWAETDPARLVSLAMLPYWDRAACLKEMERCISAGHKGILFANKFEQVGLPGYCDPYWDSVYAAAQDMDVPVSFHIGFSNPEHAVRNTEEFISNARAHADEMKAARPVFSANTLMNQCSVLGTLLTSGLCERFPKVKLISTESGFGQIPYYLEALDYHWRAFGNPREPMLPSEYFARQCYGTLWYERTTLELLHLYPTNFMFSTDYPHPTSLSPGPASDALPAAEHVQKYYADLDPVIRENVLSANAKRLYRV
jgi:predicted TIM-barrel fold metal-dependent hydrolase